MDTITRHELTEDQRRRNKVRSRIFDLRVRISRLERKLTTRDANGNEIRIGDVLRLNEGEEHWYVVTDILPWNETINVRRLHPGILEGNPRPGCRVQFAGHSWTLMRLNEDKSAVLDDPRRLRRR